MKEINHGGHGDHGGNANRFSCWNGGRIQSVSFFFTAVIAVIAVVQFQLSIA
jgi:hypothetical protein